MTLRDMKRRDAYWSCHNQPGEPYQQTDTLAELDRAQLIKWLDRARLLIADAGANSETYAENYTKRRALLREIEGEPK